MKREFPVEMPCPICGAISKSVSVERNGENATMEFRCGHKSLQKVLTLGKSTRSPPQLMWTNYDAFGKKIGSMSKALTETHGTVRYRLDIAEYCLKHLLSNYDNTVAFSAGLTGFLVQSKAALDSLCQEISLYYSLALAKRADYVVDTSDMISNLSKLRKSNGQLGNLLDKELGSKSSWFRNFKDFRDAEGTHRNRLPRNLILGEHRRGIRMNGRDVDLFCIETISKISEVIEESYKLMM
jgi:hypothetical protein